MAPKTRKKLKIAFIVNAFPKLSETFILNQITTLEDLGYKVDIYARFRVNDKKVHVDVKKYNLLSKTHYFSIIPENKYLRLAKAIPLFFYYFLKDPKVILASLSFRKQGKRAKSLMPFYACLPFLGKKFDIIHCHFGPCGYIGIDLKKAGIAKKIVTTFYGYDLSQVFKTNGKDYYQRLFLEGDLFLPICQYFENKLINSGCEKSKIKIHHLGIDLDTFVFKDEKPSKGTVRILSVGRLAEKKGHIYLIRALSKLDRDKEFLLRIIGEGHLRRKLGKEVEGFNLAGKVKFLGEMTQDQVSKLYQESDIFVLPSVTAKNGDEEGTPTVLAEAGACGLPTVSTRHSGIPEIVVDEKSGFLVEEKNVGDLCEKIDYLIDNPHLWKKMGKAGRNYVEKEFNIEKLGKELIEIYKRLIKNEK